MSPITTERPATAQAPEEATPREPAASALRVYWGLLLALAVVWLAGEVAALGGLAVSPATLIPGSLARYPYFGLALAGACFLHVASRPSFRELAVTAGLAVAGGCALFFLGPRLGLDVPPLSAACAGGGVASLGVLAWRAGQSRGSRRARVLAALLPACLLAVAVVLKMYFLDLTLRLCPTTCDALLYAADGALGTQPSFAVGRLFDACPLIGIVAGLVYNLVPCALALLLVLHQRADPSHLRSPLPVFLLAAVAGYAIYLLFPAVGPEPCLGPAFPGAPPPSADVFAAALTTVPPAFRNCMPSLHTAWALLLCWQARPLAGWFRALMAVFLIFTLLATLGFGLHYAIDLVVAFPFALAAEAAFTALPGVARPRRLAALALGTGLVVAWLLELRFGLPLLKDQPSLMAAAALATVAGSLLAERRLSGTHSGLPTGERGG